MRRSARRLFVIVAATAVVAALAHPAAGADPGSSPADGISSPRRDLPSSGTPKMTASVARARGTIRAFVELSATPAADAAEAAAPSGPSASVSAAQAARVTADQAVNAVVAATSAQDPGATELYRTSNAVTGVALSASADSLRALAARPDVVSIRRLVPKKLENAHAAQLTNVLKSWQDLGVLGTGVRVGIIDSGIDYTHANFGGPGTPAAYRGVNPTGATSLFPNAKVTGGVDLAGEDYDAASDDPAQFTPHPDRNPIDCEGHGSHVAGTAAGYGVNADGSTFRGNYRTLNPRALDAMRIGPGMAPKAQLYAIKVFGCGEEASTDLTGLGIDRALDPNQDGDFSDHLDVVNLSLGGDYASPDDPDSLFVRNAFRHGVLLVMSMGNAGDAYDAGGAPGNTPEALAVASIRDEYELLDALQVTQPTAKAGLQPGQYGVEFDLTGYSRTAPVVPVERANADGCDAIRTDLHGKFAWLEWDDNDATRRCGSATRSDNAEAAGALGVILTSTLTHFTAGIAGNADIPAFQMKASATNALRPALNAGTLRIRLGGDLRQRINFVDPRITDTPSSFTSRGTRSPGVKPDLAAPGDTIVSTGIATGNKPSVLSGTSMASPHVAGIAALVRSLHPDWSPNEVKADLMNTAGHDVHSLDGPGGPIEAPNRVGSGRVDARAALGNLVMAASTDKGAPISVGFGALDVADPTLSRTKTVLVHNKGNAPVSYQLSYRAITTIPGVSYRLSRSTLTVPAHGKATFDVTLTAVRDAMRKTADPTIAKLQADLPRQFLADASGRVELRPVSGTTWPLRVPVYAAPKPTSGISVPDSVGVSGPNGSGFLRLGGRGLNQGSGDAAYRSLFSVVELGATSPRLPSCPGGPPDGCTINGTAKSADLRYVGAGTTAPQSKAVGRPGDALLYFGVATWENWYNLGVNTVPFVDFDVDHDGEADFETYVFRATETDLLLVETDDLHTGDVVDVEPINMLLGDVDSNTFDTNVAVLPVFLETLGINPRAGSHRITYQVGTFSFYGEVLDVARPVSYDPLAPGVRAEGASPDAVFLAQPGRGVTIKRNQGALAKDHSRGDLLVLNFHNRTGGRAKVTHVAVPS